MQFPLCVFVERVSLWKMGNGNSTGPVERSPCPAGYKLSAPVLFSSYLPVNSLFDKKVTIMMCVFMALPDA